MKRLSLIGSWKRIGVQVGLLAGIGLAFVGGTQPPQAVAEPPDDCLAEGMCSFKKPLFLIILDYSTSMNTVFMAQGTRWENAVSAVNQALASDNGFVISNFVLGLMRFGHDPSAAAGTTIPMDSSGIVDGQKLDVPFYDAADPNKKYYECGQGDAISDALAAIQPPINGNLFGIGTWTKGALVFARNYFDKTLADHPSDGVEATKRLRSILLITDGEWTDSTGTMKLKPPAESPNPIALDMFDNDKIPTYVVAIGEAEGKAFANDLAAAGGTTAAYDAANPQALIDALQMVVQDLIAQQVSPICTPGLPRIMVLLDASSSMLNLNGGAMRAKAGQGGWNQARDALAGDMSIFDQMANDKGEVQDLVHLGLSVFGGNVPDESAVLVQYGPCRKDNFGWALDPQNSCGNGCVDPYADAPITWTFVDGSTVDPPGFDAKTLSHMPKCDQGVAPNKGCFGSGTYTHLGLNRVRDNITAYKAECSMNMAEYPCDNGTQFINILITDGQTNSLPGEYNPPLMTMLANGTKTYVIGFGDGVDSAPAIASLNAMAVSGGTTKYYDANNQVELQDALADIIEGVNFDPCCKFNDCAFNPEPTTLEDDPVPPVTDSAADSSSSGDLTTASETGVDTSTSDTTNPIDTDPSTDPGTSDPSTDPSNPSNPSTSDTEPPATTDDSDSSATSDTPTEPSPTTGSNPTTNPTQTTPSGDEGDSEDEETTFGGSSSTTVGAGDDEGCGCSTDDQSPVRGLLGTFLSLGLAGFIRRRRRA